MATNPRRVRDARQTDGGFSLTNVESILWDQRVMDRIAAGDEAAMMLLYERYGRLVFSIGVQVLGDSHAAEDIAQEVFLYVWRNSARFDSNRGSLGGWLAVITRHRAIDALRRKNRECSLEFGDGSDCSLQRAVELSEAASRVAAVLPSMPVSQRIALGLAYFYGLTHSEISDRTGEPLGTVKSRIRMALEFLRKALVNRKIPQYPVPIDPTFSSQRK